jgi:hypothetical protein
MACITNDCVELRCVSRAVVLGPVLINSEAWPARLMSGARANLTFERAQIVVVVERRKPNKQLSAKTPPPQLGSGDGA